MKINIEIPSEGFAEAPQADAPLRERVIHNLRTVMDPELPLNIYDLGLIYKLDISPTGGVAIEMTLTAPGCPVAGEMPGMVQAAVLKTDGVTHCTVKLVWEPKWDKNLLSEEARLELGLM
jgi:FeS assembly SUF system protein